MILVKKYNVSIWTNQSFQMFNERDISEIMPMKNLVKFYFVNTADWIIISHLSMLWFQFALSALHRTHIDALVELEGSNQIGLSRRTETMPCICWSLYLELVTKIYDGQKMTRCNPGFQTDFWNEQLSITDVNLYVILTLLTNQRFNWQLQNNRSENGPGWLFIHRERRKYHRRNVVI